MLTTDLFLIIFVWIDELLKQHPEILQRPGPEPEISDSEMMTLMLLQGLTGNISDESWLRQVGRDFKDCFPKIPERTRYQRRRRILNRGLDFLLSRIHQALGEDSQVRIVDSAPIPICRNVRAKRCRIFQGEARFGYCAAQKMYYFGFKLHLMITENGLPVVWKILTAKRHDRKGLDALLANQKTLDVYGDKAYLLKQRDREQLTERGISVTAPSRKNMKPLPKEKAQQLKRLRFRVDWIIGLLSRVFHIQRTLARVMHTFNERVSFLLAAFNVGVLVNTLLERPTFHIKSLAA